MGPTRFGKHPPVRSPREGDAPTYMRITSGWVCGLFAIAQRANPAASLSSPRVLEQSSSGTGGVVLLIHRAAPPWCRLRPGMRPTGP